MARYPVTVPPRVLAGLRRHAAACMPAECCGALMGVAEREHAGIRTLIALDNQERQPGRYRIEADVVLRLERRAAGAGVRLVGFYHSHPRGDAQPSALDLELACPGYVHLIVVPHSGAVRAWRLRDDRAGFTELPLSLPVGEA